MRYALLVLAGCNPVFGIADTDVEPDAPPPIDEDMDGTPDSVDNCPGLANADQYDLDEDSLGDACDNCPHIANRDQATGGDNDLVGDACDPHPSQDSDCLVLLDLFRDPDQFDAHWDIVATVPPQRGMLERWPQLTPANPDNILLLARDDAGMRLSGTFETQILAMADMPPDGAAYAMSNVTTVGTGYGCGIDYIGSSIEAIAYLRPEGTLPNFFPSHMSGPNVDSTLSLRLLTPTMATAAVRCRVDYGFSVGVARIGEGSQSPSATGAAGLMFQGMPITLQAVALYARRASCPTPIYR